ncbi:MAG TPA: RNA polymerase factor sigma-54, partial [Gammaproteobacteria bacterium]|nr:RNA polymerase factor sigma-54 [Gammaproteobacteria bacterium]
MKQTLQLRLGQQLTMTPQLQQAIRLLQLSSLELQTEIQETLESNPMLDTDEESAEDEHVSEDDLGSLTAQEPNADGANGADATPVDGSSDGFEEDFSSAWSVAGHGIASGEDDRDFFETQSSGADNLRDHLLEQLHLSALASPDQEVAAAIIESVRDDGYLGDPLEEIIAGLAREGLEIDAEDAEVVLHQVQHFDPPGIAARDPRECMQIQLQRIDADWSGLETARRIIDRHIELLAAHDFKGLRRALKVSQDELADAIAVIQSLDPHPGSQISSATPQYIAPDVFVRKERGVWKVRLNPDIAPRLRINPTYS